MKIDKLKKKIKYSLISIVTAVIIISALLVMYFYLNASFLDQYDKIVMDIADIKNKTQEIERKTQENKKYMELWSKINANRKSLEGIKVDEINKLIANLSEKYSVSGAIFKISVPENYPSKTFQNETISIIYSIAELSFSAYHDVKALQFVDEFVKYLHGYPIITRLEFSKERDYVVKDYFDISAGKYSAAIKGKLIFSWYVYKEADSSKNKESPSNQKSTENEKL
jgi:hypothetical protein